MVRIPAALKTIFRILTFRATREEIVENSIAILAVAILLTWIVGIGRWWDDPRDLLPFVRWGVGSILYVFALAALLWIVSAPIVAERLAYHQIAAFVASTSLPGLVYAVPMERWTDLDTAALYNVIALAFVSLYRVSLLLWFFIRVQQLDVGEAVVATFLPISAIILALTGFGHGASIMDIMGGFRDRMSKSDMEMIVGMIGCLSFVIGPVLLLIFIAMVAHNRTARTKL